MMTTTVKAEQARTAAGPQAAAPGKPVAQKLLTSNASSTRMR